MTRYWGRGGHISDSILGEGEHISDSILGEGGAQDTFSH